MPDSPTLSVCIVTFNSGDTIAECLDSVARQRGISTEVVVVDNASTDDSANRAESFPFCRVIRNPRNAFFAPANNQALHASRGEFVLVLNPDTVLEPDTAATMIEYLRDNPEVGAAICTIVGDAADGAPEVPHFWARRHVWDLLASLQPWLWWRERRAAHDSRAVDVPAAGQRSPRDVDVISDACLFARRGALESIGWYDERYRLYFTEDDLCHRFWRRGWRVRYVPHTRVRHHGSTSTRKVPRLWLRWLTVRDLCAYAQQYLGVGAAVAVALASALDLALVAAVRGGKWLAARVGDVRASDAVT
ncbi:MAG TPA: glycosyltransferase family 2 protein [Candidatus Binatia bacterium]|nr:glycosyltransferase family 2 protein [Candidatus Binatia bacterium]